jgi:hypothetical protein
MDKEDLAKELENAFSGKSDYGNFELVRDEATGKYVSKVKAKAKKAKRPAGAPPTLNVGVKPALEPILEESTVTANLQVVPMTYDHQKKQRNALLKQKAAQFVNNEIN